MSAVMKLDENYSQRCLTVRGVARGVHSKLPMVVIGAINDASWPRLDAGTPHVHGMA